MCIVRFVADLHIHEKVIEIMSITNDMHNGFAY